MLCLGSIEIDCVKVNYVIKRQFDKGIIRKCQICVIRKCVIKGLHCIESDKALC